MAETIGALLISAAFGEAAAGFTIGGTGITLATATGTAAILGVTIGLNYALQETPKQPKPADGLLSIRQTNPVRQGGYGRCRIAGSYMLYDVVGGNQSVDILALVSGQIGGFRSFFLNDDAVGLSAQQVQGFNGRYDGDGSQVGFDWRVGLPRESSYPVGTTNFPSIWTTNHRGDGVVSLAMSCLQATVINAQPTRFPSGLPTPSAACDLFLLWDARDTAQDPDDPDTWINYPVYNPATTYAAGDRVILAALPCGIAYNAGTTYARYDRVSSGGADWYSRVDGNIGVTPGTNYTKWVAIGAPYYCIFNGTVGVTPEGNTQAWCSVLSNPVLQLIDFLTNTDHGMGLDRNILIMPVIDSLMAKANLCDQLVLDKLPSLRQRYTSNGKFNFDDDPADVLGQIAATCDAWFCEDGDGALALEVGVYQEPTLTLSFDRGHLLFGPFSIHYGVADEQVVNELNITFTNPAANYKEAPGQAWRNEADISARGVTRSQALAVKWVQSHSQARRLAKRAMARLTAARGTLTTTLYGLRALGQRWVRIQYPFVPELSDAVVELSRASIDFMNGRVTFDWLLVDPATIDAWNPATEEGEGPAV